MPPNFITVLPGSPFRPSQTNCKKVWIERNGNNKQVGVKLVNEDNSTIQFIPINLPEMSQVVTAINYVLGAYSFAAGLDVIWKWDGGEVAGHASCDVWGRTARRARPRGGA